MKGFIRRQGRETGSKLLLHLVACRPPLRKIHLGTPERVQEVQHFDATSASEEASNCNVNGACVSCRIELQ